MFKRNKNEISKSDYLDTLIKLEKDGSDALANIGEGLLVLLGGAGGAASAALVGALGLVTTTTTVAVPATLLGSTALASFFGMAGTTAAVTTAIATPIGWVAGASVAGAAAVFGLSRLVRSGCKNEERRQRMKENIKNKVTAALEQSKTDNESEKIKKIADLLHTGYLQKKISLADGSLIISQLKTNKITPDYALKAINDML